MHHITDHYSIRRDRASTEDGERIPAGWNVIETATGSIMGFDRVRESRAEAELHAHLLELALDGPYDQPASDDRAPFQRMADHLLRRTAEDLVTA